MSEPGAGPGPRAGAGEPGAPHAPVAGAERAGDADAGRPGGGAAAGRIERWRRVTALGLPPSYPIAQVPNGPAIVAILASLLRRVVEGRADDVAFAVFVVALTVWAWEEAARGVNVVRRLLGVGALAYAVLRVADALA